MKGAHPETSTFIEHELSRTFNFFYPIGLCVKSLKESQKCGSNHYLKMFPIKNS